MSNIIIVKYEPVVKNFKFESELSASFYQVFKCFLQYSSDFPNIFAESKSKFNICDSKGCAFDDLEGFLEHLLDKSTAPIFQVRGDGIFERAIVKKGLPLTWDLSAILICDKRYIWLLGL